MILQNQSVQGTTDFSFTVNRNDFARTLDLLNNQIGPAVGAGEIVADDKVCKVSIVGIGMRSHVGVASLMFRTLSEEGINIQMISTSEIKTSRSAEHTSELQSLMRNSYAVFCLKKKQSTTQSSKISHH